MIVVGDAEEPAMAVAAAAFWALCAPGRAGPDASGDVATRKPAATRAGRVFEPGGHVARSRVVHADHREVPEACRSKIARFAMA